MKIPFNRADVMGRELDYVAEAIRGGHISGDGPFTKRCQKLLEEALGVPKVLLTGSCTHALEMSALLLDLQPGDEVIVPSFSFVSTVNAFVLHGAKPVFVDVREDTLNMDEKQLAAKVGPRTRAIVPVHYAGIGCAMREIRRIARSCGAAIVEDAAHGLFGKVDGQFLGTLGEMATLSFHETKNFTCGEGGALVLNDGRLVDRAEILREKGTNRSRFFRGYVDKYTWVDVGSSFVASDILAAFLLGQLETRIEVQGRREEMFLRYFATLSQWSQQHGVRLPALPEAVEPAWHLFYLIFRDLAIRQRFIAWMKDAEILCVFHYLPLNDSPMGHRFGFRRGDCPVSERISDTLVRLPFFFGLTESEQDRVIDRVTAFRP